MRPQRKFRSLTLFPPVATGFTLPGAGLIESAMLPANRRIPNR
jgi:hypothetical protein